MTISERCWKADQSWKYEHVFATDDGQRLRTSIVRNSNDFQSYGRIDRWDGSQWREVLTRDISEMEPEVIKLSPYSAFSATAATFSESADVMEEIALDIVRIIPTRVNLGRI